MDASSSPHTPEPLPMRWAVILLSAAVAALLVGALTYAETASWPAAILAGLAGAGTTLTALHRILGK